MDVKTPRAANCEFNYEFIRGIRHQWKLLYVKDEQQFYKRKKVCGNYYECKFENCDRRVQIRDGKCFAASGLHDHPNQAGLYTDLRALNEMKRIARNINNRLNAREIFNTVKKRYPDCTVVFKKHQRCLQRIRADVLKKNTQIVSEDADNEELESIFANRTANYIAINHSKFQSIVKDVTNGSMSFEGIKIVEMIPSDRSTHDMSRVDTIIVNAGPDDVFYKTAESIAESTMMEHISIQASNTCSQMEKMTNELGNNQVLKVLGNVSIIDKINAYWTLY